MKPLPANCSIVFGEGPTEAGSEPAWWAQYGGKEGNRPETVGPFETAAEAQEEAYKLWGPTALNAKQTAKPEPVPSAEGPQAVLAAQAWRAEKNGLPLFAVNFENALRAKAEELANAANRLQTVRTNGSGPQALARELEAAGTFNGLELVTARANYYLGLLRAEELLGKAK